MHVWNDLCDELDFDSHMSLKDKLLQSAYISLGPIVGWTHATYSGPLEDLVRSYASDIAIPLAMYYSMRMTSSLVRKHPLLNAAYLFTGCAVIETMQALHWERGTFDPWDYLAYAAGLGLALVVDKLTLRQDEPASKAIAHAE